VVARDGGNVSGPKISLVMATWNGAAYLKPQLGSLLVQTQPPFEMIVCDDASEDETTSILSGFIEVAPFPVTVYRRNERIGYARNFSGTLGSTSGEIILFSDQDDLWHPRKIELVAAAMQATGAGVMSHDFTMFQHDGPVLVPSYFDLLAREGMPRDIGVHGCAMAVRRSFIGQWGRPLGRSGISHDFWFGFLASAVGERAFLDKKLIRHRIHGANASGWIPSSDDFMPELAAMLASDGTDPLDAMLEVFLKPGRHHWIAPLQTALRERASPQQAARAQRVIERLEIVERWLRPTPSETA
jgi:glycosyltransferase involved in cell wall biosynthesis